MTSRHGKQYHIPRVVQEYADASGVMSGSSGRTCTACGARMRRGHDQYRTECDPCYSVAHPYQAPTPAPTHRCQWCSRAYTPEHPNQLRYCGPTCRNCARKARERVRKLAAYKRSKNTSHDPPRNHLGQFTGHRPAQRVGQYD